MKRKLVKQGAATLMVSLPSKWLRKLGLGKGDEVDVSEEDGSLVVAREGHEARKETEITITKDTETSLRTLIVNAYTSGYDSIRVKFSTAKQFEAIKKAIKEYTLGFDITKREKDFCVIESIADPSAEQFDAIMNKIFFSVREMIALTRSRLEGKKVADDYVETGLRVHQYSAFCRRIVSKKKKDVKDANLFWAFHTNLVHGQRDLYHINRFLDSSPVRASRDTLALIDGASAMFELLAKGYHEKDTKCLEEMHDLEKELIYRKGYSLLSRKTGKEAVVIHHLLDSIRNFYLVASPLMGLSL